MRNNRRLTLWSLAVAALISAPFTPASQSVYAQSGVIFACVANNGSLRYVSSAAQCRNNEVAVQWSITGPQGPAGPAGAQGPAGADGAAGAQGPAGPAGANGTNGVDGGQGPAGPAGANGTNGVDGAPGPQGPAGPAGANGTNGVDGAAGPAGPQGPAGPAGATGATGAQGPAGPAGATGATGAQGPAGPAGATGATGAQGPAGPAGATGAQGPQGSQGPAGASGAGSATVVEFTGTLLNNGDTASHTIFNLPSHQARHLECSALAHDVNSNTNNMGFDGKYVFLRNWTNAPAKVTLHEVGGGNGGYAFAVNASGNDINITVTQNNGYATNGYYKMICKSYQAVP